jgi:hypothetical protein
MQTHTLTKEDYRSRAAALEIKLSHIRQSLERFSRVRVIASQVRCALECSGGCVGWGAHARLCDTRCTRGDPEARSHACARSSESSDRTAKDKGWATSGSSGRFVGTSSDDPTASSTADELRRGPICDLDEDERSESRPSLRGGDLVPHSGGTWSAPGCWDLTADALKQRHELRNLKTLGLRSGEGRWTVTEAIEPSVPRPHSSRTRHGPLQRSRDEYSYADPLLAGDEKTSSVGHAGSRKRARLSS